MLSKYFFLLILVLINLPLLAQQLDQPAIATPIIASPDEIESSLKRLGFFRLVRYDEVNSLKIYNKDYFTKGVKGINGEVILPARFSAIEIVPMADINDPVLFLVRWADTDLYNIINSKGGRTFANDVHFAHVLDSSQVILTTLDPFETRCFRFSDKSLTSSVPAKYKSILTQTGITERDSSLVVSSDGNYFGVIDVNNQFIVPWCRAIPQFRNEYKSLSFSHDKSFNYLVNLAGEILWFSHDMEVLCLSEKSFVTTSKEGRNTILSYSLDTVFTSADFSIHCLLGGVGYIYISQKSGLKGMLNAKGVCVLEAEYVSILQPPADTLLILRTLAGQMGVCGVSGHIIVPVNYSSIECQKLYSEDYRSKTYFVVGDDEGKSLLDLAGKPIVPGKYEDIIAGKFKSICLFKRDGFWRIFNYQGQQLSGQLFTEAYTLKESPFYDDLTKDQKRVFSGCTFIVGTGNGYVFGVLNDGELTEPILVHH